MLSPLFGHHEARAAAAAALRAEKLPQSLLLHGAAGIGKERFGLWLAQLLVCERAAAEPCRECGPCRWAERVEHPDIHWFFPLPRPDGASTPDRLRSKLEEQRAAELQARRANPLYLPRFDKAPAYFLASVQALQSIAAARPAAGRCKVFVVGDAEAMVPQESSPEAANAFLKLLEEPPADTVLIVTSSRPGALLPTIRSRLLPFRLAPLPTRETEAFLLANGVPPEHARQLSFEAGGAPGEAVRLLAAEAESERGPRTRARSWIQAVASAGPVQRLQIASGEAPSGGRGEFSQTLDLFADRLRDLLAISSGATEALPEGEDRQLLEGICRQLEPHPVRVAAAVERVGGARDLASGNVNPQLILAVLLRNVQNDLGGGP